jgi:hypothetical protein
VTKLPANAECPTQLRNALPSLAILEIMAKTTVGSTDGKGGDSPSKLIDARIKELGDWRGETLVCPLPMRFGG